jgi:hypothetical protein
VTGIQSGSQDGSEDKVVATPREFITPGAQETLLRANRIKVVGVCATDSAELKIAPVQGDDGTLRAVTVYADSHTRGYTGRASSTGVITIGSAPPGDRGNFNAFNSARPGGSLDGSFLAHRLHDGCQFQASAIAS